MTPIPSLDVPRRVPVGAARLASTLGRRRRAALACCSAVWVLIAADSNAQCTSTWSTAIAYPGVSGMVSAMVTYDDGTGPALYVGGNFAQAGGVTVNNIGRFDGAQWTPLGAGVNGNVYALGAWNDGTGTKLFAAGNFSTAGGVSANCVARWDGISWTAVGGGISSSVFALTVFDDGTGPALFAAGYFLTAGSVAAGNIAKWNGVTWSSLGAGLSGGVFALAVHDTGSGPALYATGGFSTAGGVPASNIARWDGAAWTALGGGINFLGRAVTSFDDGTGPGLFVGGSFNAAGPVPANRVAKWDGAAWSALGAGLGGTGFTTALAMTTFDDGNGPALWVGGLFATAGGIAANRVARWDGTTWSALGLGTDASVFALGVFDHGSGPGLYCGGTITTAGVNTGVGALAEWTGTGGPIIVAQPQTTTVGVTQPATLSVGATGVGPFTYQWRHNNAIAATTGGPSLTLSATTSADAGSWDVVVSNACGARTSQAITITVLQPLLGFSQPLGPGSLAITNISGPAGSNWFTALSFDPLNATAPGAGFWGGLHISVADLFFEFGFQTPPFVGVYPASGNTYWAIPGGTISAIAGYTAYGVTHQYDPSTFGLLGHSPVAAITLQ